MVYSRIFFVYSSSTGWLASRPGFSRMPPGWPSSGSASSARSKTPKKLHFRDYNPIGVATVRQRILACYFNRKLLVTTVTLDSAIAAEASIGESSPSAATGIPITL